MTVDRHEPAAGREVHQGDCLATEARSARLAHAEGPGRRDRRVDRVAAGGEHRQPGLARGGKRAGHRAAAGGRRRRALTRAPHQAATRSRVSDAAWAMLISRSSRS